MRRVTREASGSDASKWENETRVKRLAGPGSGRTQTGLLSGREEETSGSPTKNRNAMAVSGSGAPAEPTGQVKGCSRQEL